MEGDEGGVHSPPPPPATPICQPRAAPSRPIPCPLAKSCHHPSCTRGQAGDMWQLPPQAASAVPQFPPPPAPLPPRTWGLGQGRIQGQGPDPELGAGLGHLIPPPPQLPCLHHGAGSALKTRSHTGTRSHAAPMTGIQQVPVHPPSKGTPWGAGNPSWDGAQHHRSPPAPYHARAHTPTAFPPQSIVEGAGPREHPPNPAADPWVGQ